LHQQVRARVRLGLNAKTIAQFLNDHDRYDCDTKRYFINPKGRKYSQDKTVIVDEASMLTEDQFSALIDTLIDVERFILVGDPRQLPPIEAGRPFIDIVQYIKPEKIKENQPKVYQNYAELETLCRQKSDDCAISGEERMDVKVAKLFGNYDAEKNVDDIFELLALKSDWETIKFVNWYNAKELETKLLEEIKQEFNNEGDEQQAFDAAMGATFEGNNCYFNIGAERKIEDWQILSPIKGFGFGTKEINRLIQRKFRDGFMKLAQNVEKKTRLIANLWVSMV
jgi:ATP-dependent exoDNAse (exonuclease V) alpha subunit